MLQLHLSDQQFNCPLRVTYIRDLSVFKLNVDRKQFVSLKCSSVACEISHYFYNSSILNFIQFINHFSYWCIKCIISHKLVWEYMEGIASNWTWWSAAKLIWLSWLWISHNFYLKWNRFKVSWDTTYSHYLVSRCYLVFTCFLWMKSIGSSSKRHLVWILMLVYLKIKTRWTLDMSV